MSNSMSRHLNSFSKKGQTKQFDNQPIHFFQVSLGGIIIPNKGGKSMTSWNIIQTTNQTTKPNQT